MTRHQWLFVGDTTDVMFPPDDWTSEAIVDRINATLLSRKTSEGATEAAAAAPRAIFRAPLQGRSVSLRSPILGAGGVASLETLAPFFREVSLASYEASYNSIAIDADGIEELLSEDMFSHASIS